MIDPSMKITLSRSDRGALLRLAKACSHRRAVNWLESARRDDDGWYTVYMGDMRVYLTEIMLDFDVARTVRSGSAFTHDLDVTVHWSRVRWLRRHQIGARSPCF